MIELNVSSIGKITHGIQEATGLVVNGNLYSLAPSYQLIASGFSANNYGIIPGAYRSVTNAVYEVEFTTDNNASAGGSQFILHGQKLIHLGYLRDRGCFTFYNWGAESLEEKTIPYTQNTTYFVRVEINSPTITYTFFTNGSMLDTYTMTDTGLLAHPSSDFIFISSHTQHTQSWVLPFQGTINVSKLKIKVGNSVIFRGNDAFTIKRNDYSNFESNKYLTIPSQYLSYDPSDNVEYEMSFTTGSSFSSGKQQLLHCGTCGQLYFSTASNVLKYWNGTERTGYNILALDTNKRYWVKFGRVNQEVYAKVSEDGITWSEPITSTDSYSESTVNGYIGHFNDVSEPRPFGGIIHMDDFKVKINGTVVIDGKNDVVDNFNTVGSIKHTNTYVEEYGRITLTSI